MQQNENKDQQQEEMITMKSKIVNVTVADMIAHLSTFDPTAIMVAYAGEGQFVPHSLKEVGEINMGSDDIEPDEKITNLKLKFVCINYQDFQLDLQDEEEENDIDDAIDAIIGVSLQDMGNKIIKSLDTASEYISVFAPLNDDFLIRDPHTLLSFNIKKTKALAGLIEMRDGILGMQNIVNHQSNKNKKEIEKLENLRLADFQKINEPTEPLDEIKTDDI